MITEHSKLFGFSSAYIWSHCVGSIIMNATEENPSTEESMLGDATHWVGEIMLESFKERIDGIGVEVGGDAIGHPAPNGVIVTEDIYDAALTYYQAVTDVVQCDVQRKLALLVEARVHAASIDEEAWGTGDSFFYWPATNTLYGWDYKNGHRRVEAFENLQLAGYAQAYCETHGLANLNPRLVLTIIQPRCYDGRGSHLTWETTLDGIRAYVNHLRQAAQDYRAGKNMCTTGPWCRDCLSRYKCPAILNAGASAIDYSTTAIPNNLSNDALAYELTVSRAAIKRLEQREDALAAEADGRIRKGNLIPGWRMAETFGQNKWNRPDAMIIAMGDALDVDLRAPTKCVSPFQMSKVFKKKGVDEVVIKPYYGKPKTGLRLSVDDGSKARQVFSGGKLK